MKEKKQSKNKVIVIVLTILLLGALIFTFYNSNEYKKLTNELNLEKEEIQKNLDSLIVQYDIAINENTSISQDLEIEREKIIQLRDSIKNLHNANYRIIRRYKNEIASLEKTTKRLFSINDSLSNANKMLTIDLDSANVRITREVTKNKDLSLENQNLSEKVAIGSILKVNDIKITAMKKKSSGKLVETSRSRSTDTFRINFIIEQNDIAISGERMVYVQLADSNGTTISPVGETELFDERTISYTEKSTVNYINKPIDFISLLDVDRKTIEKGSYTVNIFLDSVFVGTNDLILK